MSFFYLTCPFLTNVLLVFRFIYDLELNDHGGKQENGTGRGQRKKGAKWRNVVWPRYVPIPYFLCHTNYLLCVDDMPASKKKHLLSVLPLSSLSLTSLSTLRVATMKRPSCIAAHLKPQWVIFSFILYIILGIVVYLCMYNCYFICMQLHVQHNMSSTLNAKNFQKTCFKWSFQIRKKENSKPSTLVTIDNILSFLLPILPLPLFATIWNPPQWVCTTYGPYVAVSHQRK